MNVPMDWRGACIVPLFKGKVDNCECIGIHTFIEYLGIS